ncbi:MAG: MFS transporter [Patescibacteria group bacterium]
MKNISLSSKILLATNGLILLSGAMLAPIYALFVEKIGGSILDASLTGGIFALSAGITAIMSGKYTDKIKESELIIVFGYFLLGIGFFLYSRVNSIYALFFVQILVGFGEAIYSPAFDAVYTKHMNKKSTGKLWGLWEGINYFVISAGIMLGGFIVFNFGFNILFYIMSSITIISAIYMLFLPRKVL